MTDIGAPPLEQVHFSRILVAIATSHSDRSLASVPLNQSYD
ncbi:MAG: hypothetical protein WA902_14040 [Thermosynechococcaceae cyanobacterium]